MCTYETSLIPNEACQESEFSDNPLVIRLTVRGNKIPKPLRYRYLLLEDTHLHLVVLFLCPTPCSSKETAKI